MGEPSTDPLQETKKHQENKEPVLLFYTGIQPRLHLHGAG